ncbi:basic proline-rich protein-like [Columba livia]|uniref:basic proline-rich protein-like n=1 Tax=Columba livia TaxID=8932 RepID=UPI0031BA8BCF
MRLEVSVRLFRRSRRKRKTAGKIPALPLGLFCEESGLALRHPGDDAGCSQSPPMRSRRGGGSWHRPGGAQEGSEPAGSNRHPSRPAATRCCTAAPSPLPPQPHHVLILRPGGRPGSAASLPHPFPPLGGPGSGSSPAGPGEEKGCARRLPKPPMRALGRCQPINTRCAPVPPQPGGARGPGRKRRRHDVMQTAMGFTTAAAFFWGMGGGGRGRTSCSAVPSPGPPPPLPAQCSWCRSRTGSSPTDPRPARHSPRPATRPARRRGRGPGERRPALSGGERAPHAGEGEAGPRREGTGPGRPHGRPRRKGKEATEEAGPQLCGAPAQRGGGASAATSPLTPRGPGRERLRPPTTPSPRASPPSPTPPREESSNADPTIPGSAAKLRVAPCAPAPAAAQARRGRSSYLPWRGGGWPSGGCTNCATTSGGG